MEIKEYEEFPVEKKDNLGIVIFYVHELGFF